MSSNDQRYLRRKARLLAAGLTSNGKPPKARKPKVDPRLRFWAKVQKSDGCWLWRAGLNHSGYGKFSVNRNTIAAHRVAYEYCKGPIPEGMLVCHSCDNPQCVNPDHLWLGTWNDNMQDKVAKGRQSKGPSHQSACNGNRNAPRGEAQHMAKLTEETVKEIRELREKTGLSYKKIANRFGICAQSAFDAVKRKTWAHVA